MSYFFNAVMQIHLLLLLLPDITQATTRIIGGRTASIKDLPYQLSLRFESRHICGASIISHKIAVSAAHCFPKPGPYSVKAGATSLTEPGVVIHVDQALIHPNYHADSVDYDIALLFLNRPLTFSEKIKPIALPNSGPNNALKSGVIGRVSGWGMMYSTREDSFSTELREVELPVWDWWKCREVYKEDMTRRLFCAGLPQGGKDSCKGDSGGPFVVNGVLYGIVSAGMDCAQAGFPGLYTNVQVLRGFIKEYAGF